MSPWAALVVIYVVCWTYDRLGRLHPLHKMSSSATRSKLSRLATPGRHASRTLCQSAGPLVDTRHVASEAQSKVLEASSSA